MHGNAIDLTGRRFGQLVVVSHAASGAFGIRWLCQCDCGNTHTAYAGNLKNNSTKSCGCAQHTIVHGGSYSSEYAIWKAMRRRCGSARCIEFKNYGGRGITVCPRWAQSFKAFQEDMGPRPSAAYTLDRINNEGNYEPGNCRWATRIEQASNTRRSRFIELNGEWVTLSEAGRRLGVTLSTVMHAISLGTYGPVVANRPQPTFVTSPTP